MLPEIMAYYAKSGTSFAVLTQTKTAELSRLPGAKQEALKLVIPLCERIAEALDAAFREEGEIAGLVPTNELLYRALYAQLIRLQHGMQESAFAATIDGRAEKRACHISRLRSASKLSPAKNWERRRWSRKSQASIYSRSLTTPILSDTALRKARRILDSNWSCWLYLYICKK